VEREVGGSDANSEMPISELGSVADVFYENMFEHQPGNREFSGSVQEEIGLSDNQSSYFSLGNLSDLANTSGLGSVRSSLHDSVQNTRDRARIRGREELDQAVEAELLRNMEDLFVESVRRRQQYEDERDRRALEENLGDVVRLNLQANLYEDIDRQERADFQSTLEAVNAITAQLGWVPRQVHDYINQRRGAGRRGANADSEIV
jgi:hypothetical protein